jgi:hypothetical protein
MTTLTSAAELAGLILLILAIALVVRRRPARPQPARRQPARPDLRLISRQATPTSAIGRQQPRSGPKPVLVLVEDRVPGPAALELEETVSAGDEEDAVPEAGSVLATRDR